MEIYIVNQSEYRKIRTRNDSIFGNFSRSDSKRKKAVSPKVMRDISTKSPKTMELFGIPPPLWISLNNVKHRNNPASCVLPGSPVVGC